MRIAAVRLDRQATVPSPPAPLPDAAPPARAPRAREPVAQGTAASARQPEGRPKASRLTPATMDFYKDEAHQMRAEAVRRFSGGAAAGIARLWRAALPWLRAPIATWLRVRRAALMLRVRRASEKGLAAID